MWYTVCITVDGVSFENISLETAAGCAVYLCVLRGSEKICVLRILPPHGKRGTVKLNSKNVEFINVKITSDEQGE